MSILNTREGSGIRGSGASRASVIDDSAGVGLETGVDEAWRTYIDVGTREISDKFV